MKRETYLEAEELIKYVKMNFIPFFPLASGFLTGKYKKNVIPKGSRGEWADHMKVMFSDKYYKFIGDLGKITKRNKITLPELAISWLLYYENITSVICGVRSVEQLKMNIKSANLLLDNDDLKQIDDAYSILIS